MDSTSTTYVTCPLSPPFMLHNLAKRGFEFFNDLGVTLTIEEIGSKFGGIYKVPTMPLVQTLCPRSKNDAPLNTYSGLYGHGAFPFHTDMAHWHRPPRYMVLRCVTPNEHVGTKLVPARVVLPDYRSAVAKRALFKPRRRLDNKSFLLRVGEADLWRWDSVFIQPANQVAIQLKSEIERGLSSVSYDEIRFTKTGQVLVIDNWSMLHSRSAIPDLFQDRSIERIYLETVES